MSWVDLKSDFARVSSTLRCPVCHHSDGCLIHRSGEYAICYHEPSNVMWRTGFKHMLNNKEDVKEQIVKAPETTPFLDVDTNFPILYSAYRAAISGISMEARSKQLGVSVESLDSLGIGWSNSKQVYTHPLFDNEWTVIGIQTQSYTGDKRVLPGSKLGLFMSMSFRDKPGVTFVTEGMSDTAAALTLGLNAVGRFNDCTGSDYLTKLLHGHRVYIIADNDAGGIRGAEELAIVLRANNMARVIYLPSGTTPIKDLRAMLMVAGRGNTLHYIISEVNKSA